MGSNDSVRRFFAAHAQGYSKSLSHARGADLVALMDALGPRGVGSALDVATGTGFTALALAQFAREVVGVDMTREMLEEAGKLAVSQGITNARFELGEATNLRFPKSSFDIVTVRRATHHFNDVPKFLHETKRVLKPGGRLGLVDMSPPEGAEYFVNTIERLRDRSHVEAFTPTAWKSMILQAGLQINSLRVVGEPVSLEGWLYPVKLDAREMTYIRSAWDSASTLVKQLLGADMEEGIIRGWTKSRIVLVAANTP